MNDLPTQPTSTDPVCGMDVNTEIARALGLTSEYDGTNYAFCGKGCKLEFDEDPSSFFEPEYQPQM